MMDSKGTYIPLPEIGFLRLPEVLRIIPVSRSTWWAGIKTGRFPKAVKLGVKTTAWRIEDIRRLTVELGQKRNIED